MDQCEVIWIVLSILGFLSILLYFFGNLALDCVVIYNKNDLWETLSDSDYYYHAKIELAMLATVLCTLVFGFYFQFIDDGEWGLMPFITAYMGLGITGGAFTIMCLKDMSDSKCERYATRVETYAYNLDSGSYDAQQMLRFSYPYISNETDPFNLTQVARDWSNYLCDKDFTTKVLISGVGCVGWLAALISPVIGIFLIFILVEEAC